MPTEVAIGIFDRNGMGPWARQPKLKVALLCGGGWIDAKFSEIGEANFSASKGVLVLSRAAPPFAICIEPRVSFQVSTESKAREIVDAAIAMGATIDKMKIKEGAFGLDLGTMFK